MIFFNDVKRYNFLEGGPLYEKAFDYLAFLVYVVCL